MFESLKHRKPPATSGQVRKTGDTRPPRCSFCKKGSDEGSAANEPREWRGGDAPNH
jgi:hypothetical protein